MANKTKVPGETWRSQVPRRLFASILPIVAKGCQTWWRSRVTGRGWLGCVRAASLADRLLPVVARCFPFLTSSCGPASHRAEKSLKSLVRCSRKMHWVPTVYTQITVPQPRPPLFVLEPQWVPGGLCRTLPSSLDLVLHQPSFSASLPWLPRLDQPSRGTSSVRWLDCLSPPDGGLPSSRGAFAPLCPRGRQSRGSAPARQPISRPLPRTTGCP